MYRGKPPDVPEAGSGHDDTLIEFGLTGEASDGFTLSICHPQPVAASIRGWQFAGVWQRVGSASLGSLPKHSPIVSVGTVVSRITPTGSARRSLQERPDTNHHIVNADISAFWYDPPALKT